jgi:CHAT domain-containing protein
LVVAEALRVAKLRLSRRYIEGPGEDSDQFQSSLDSLTTLVNGLETDLSRQSASFRKKQQISVCNVDSIRASLPENSCLIEYLKFDYLKLQPDSAIPHYLVMVVSKDTEPVILNIGPAPPIDKLIDSYRQHLLRVSLAGLPSDDEVEEYRGLAKELYRLIWKPVESRTSDKDLVLIAPDGGLNLVSFAGLPDDAGTYLIERHPIHYLSAGRDLFRLKDVATPAVGLLALGDPDYDASVTDRLMNTTSHQNSVAEREYTLSQSTRMGRGEFRGMKVVPLPWTRREVNRIARAWKTTWNEPGEILCGVDASEDRLKAEAPGKRVIHLATHGYFLQDTATSEYSEGEAEQYDGSAMRNPLLKSGLFLAGANQRGQIVDSSDLDDGILTAFEVSAMNLQGTEWVVLSACESGLGEVKAGEGVWGLRRAFQMAGARTVISALWSIPDKQTVSIMEQLYSSNDVDLAHVMWQMARNEIEKIRKRGLPDHPYVWAAFVAVGDWRVQQ